MPSANSSTVGGSRPASIHSHAKDLEKSHPQQQNMEKPERTLREDVESAGLKTVMEMHGRIDLIPMPSDSPLDPLNWASWRKNALLVLVSVHAMLGPFSAAATIPAFIAFTEDFGISITQASYTVSVPIIFLGVFPLVWAPIAARIGRRPTYLISTLVAAACHLASAYCTSYGTFIITRVFQAIFICPPQAIGAFTINELFFQHEKGQKLGVWALLTTLGPPLAPFFMGFAVYHQNWHWIFYILAIVNLIQFVLYIFLGPETLYDRPDRTDGVEALPTNDIQVSGKEAWYTPYITFKRWSKASWLRVPLEVVLPLQELATPTVLLAALAYAIAFTYSNVLMTVEIPSLVGQKYKLNAQQTGLQFIAAILGCLLGEPIAGWGSDRFVAWRTRQANGDRQPEMRLPFALPGFILTTVGIIIFGCQLQNTAAGVYSVTPMVGVAFAVFGLQLVSTVSIAYAIESAKVPSYAALMVALVRQIYAFTAPFYFGIMYEGMGPAKASGVLAALVGGVALSLCLLCLFFGRSWRKA